jgi:hypothetical protein
MNAVEHTFPHETVTRDAASAFLAPSSSRSCLFPLQTLKTLVFKPFVQLRSGARQREALYAHSDVGNHRHFFLAPASC